MTRLIRLTAENVKKLKAVSITPEGNLVVIGGSNDAGKTSTLDSISYLFEGKGAQCDRPVRDGEDGAKIVGELEDLIVTRTITKEGGGALTVTGKDGAKYPSPQAMLDRLVGKLAFDPLAFTNMKPKEQLETLKALVGLDFSELDAQRKDLFDKRTEINREVSRLTAHLEHVPQYPDAPAEEVSVSALMEELEHRRSVNEENEQARKHLDKQRDYMAVIEGDIQKRQEEIRRLQKAIREYEDNLEDAKRTEADLHRKVDTLKDEDEAEIQNRIRNAEGINAKVRSNRETAKVQTELEKIQSHSKSITRALQQINHDKEEALAKAEFPVSGLSFDEHGVLFNGLPLDQAGSASRLRVSVAMAAGMNPSLKVILIRDGSLMDKNSMRLLGELAEEHDLQVWVEKVSDDGAGCQVVIEDGEVKEVDRK